MEEIEEIEGMKMYENITEIKILKVSAVSNNIEREVNDILKEGWILLDISTLAPKEIAGQYSQYNYFIYHFGKKLNTKTII